MRLLFQNIAMVLLTFLLLTSISFAYPIEYTIEGFVIKGPGINDSAGYLSLLGINIGSSVSYRISIDVDAPATKVLSNGTVVPLFPNNTMDRFHYAHYISGTTLTTETWQNSLNGLSEYNLIADETPPYHDLYMYVAKGNNALQFDGFNYNPDNWIVGTDFGAVSMRNYINDESGNSSYFNFDGRITSIVPAPVPELSTILQLCASLAGIGLLRKRNSCLF